MIKFNICKLLVMGAIIGVGQAALALAPATPSFEMSVVNQSGIPVPLKSSSALDSTFCPAPPNQIGPNSSAKFKACEKEVLAPFGGVVEYKIQFENTAPFVGCQFSATCAHVAFINPNTTVCVNLTGSAVPIGGTAGYKVSCSRSIIQPSKENGYQGAVNFIQNIQTP